MLNEGTVSIGDVCGAGNGTSLTIDSSACTALPQNP